MTKPLFTEAEFSLALHEVVTSLAQRADEERRKEDGFKAMWEASEKGLRSLISEAYHQMTRISLGLGDAIEERFKVNISKKLWDLIRALPFAMGEVRGHISDAQGMSCCADKAA